MKQLLQNYKTGKMEIAEVPAPALGSMGILVDNRYSVISVGTEKQKVETARASLLGKARARPDLVKKVLHKVRTEGLAATWATVQARLDAPTPLGYSTAGIVAEVGNEICDVSVGDRVACAGAEYAFHAERIFVPQNLFVRVPDSVGLDEASFATVGAIALQGIRQARVQVGDSVCVIGLGLLGLISVQLLKAAGCRVMGVDVVAARCERATALGADLVALRSDDVLSAAAEFTRGVGIDVVLITAGGEQNNDPIEVAGDMARDRGRVVVVGMVKMDVPRRTFYDKDLSIVFSRSYGPGRYDPLYEQQGIDYPVGYVRWTERENLREFLRLIESKVVDVRTLTTHTFEFEKALDAYELLTGPEGASAIGVLLKYRENLQETGPIVFREVTPSSLGKARIAAIGAGNFATAKLFPPLKANQDAELVSVCSGRGITAKAAAQRFGFAKIATGISDALADPDVNAVLIATRHSSHASQVAAAIRAGKVVFVEKPLALDREQLGAVTNALSDGNARLMVGYNRRFSPYLIEMKNFFKPRTGPIMMNYRVNAGQLEAGNWMRATEEGGSRLVSEGCHFIDAMTYLCGSLPKAVTASRILPIAEPDTATCIIEFEDGSIGTLTYVTNGDSSLPKELLEAHSANSSAVLNDYKILTLHRQGKANKKSFGAQDKGHVNEMRTFVNAIVKGESLGMTIAEIYSVTLATFGIVESATTGQRVDLDVAGHLPQVRQP